MANIIWFESFAVVLSTIIAVMFSFSPFAVYDLQVIALLFFIYIVLKRKFMSSFGYFTFEVSLFIFTGVVIVFSSGGLNSPLFFLLYVLIGACALLLERATLWVLAVVILSAFIGTEEWNFTLRELISLASVPLVSYVAQYVGNIHKSYRKQKALMYEFIRSRNNVKQAKTHEKEQTLLFITTILTRHFDDIKQRLVDFSGDEDLRYLKTKMKDIDNVIHKFKEYIEEI